MRKVLGLTVGELCLVSLMLLGAYHVGLGALSFVHSLF
jgi:hypothetical protein